jgi:sporulation protein YlmC with PRC-barrel domain
MKTLLISGVMTVFLGLTVASMSAQTQTTASSNTTYIQTSKFIGKKVKSAQGDEIGTVKDIVLDRSTGCLAYTVVSTSGGGGGTQAGVGGKMVAVPWAVFSPSSDLNVLTVTVDRERIYNAPVFDYARIEEYSRPDYINNVYGYFGVTAGAAVGAAYSSSTGQTQTTNVNTNTGAATGANTRAGAMASPGAATSPAQAGSPGAQASPAQRGTPAAATPRETPRGRARATASPSSRGREEGTPSGRRSRGATDTGSTSDTERQPQGSHERETDRGTHESRPDSERSGADQSSSGEKATGTRHHEKSGKRESSSPPEQPERQ